MFTVPACFESSSSKGRLMRCPERSGGDGVDEEKKAQAIIGDLNIPCQLLSRARQARMAGYNLHCLVRT